MAPPALAAPTVAGGQGQRQRVAAFDGAGPGNRLGANWCDARFPGAYQPPVTQFPGGSAVVEVVVLDLLEHGCGLVDTSIGLQFAVPRVGGDRIGGGGDITRAQLRPDVERLQRLEAEQLRTDTNAFAHERVRSTSVPLRSNSSTSSSPTS